MGIVASIVAIIAGLALVLFFAERLVKATTGLAAAFFVFNAGIIALAHPVNVERQTLWFYLPTALGAIALVSLFLMTKRISRWAGAVLALVYVVFAVGGYALFDTEPS